MRFGVLGPLEVRASGVAVGVHGEKPQLLLALLLFHANRSLNPDRLIDQLWGGSPPRTAANVLQAHVGRLRRALAPGAHGRPRLETTSSGYRLLVDADELDSDRFERLLAEGEAMAPAEPETARDRLAEALSLWRGGVLDGLDLPAELEAAAARLEERRLQAVESKLELDIRCGQTAAAVAELSPLVEAHPTRERLLGMLMLALYREGRKADALAAYRRGRQRIAEELGLDPGPELQLLERRILKQDPLLAPEPARPPEPAGQPTPAARHNLGAELTSFVGREAELAELEALIGSHRLVTVTGAGGSGKSRLLRRLGRRTLERWPDGVWLVDLSPISSGDRLPEAVAAELGIQEQAGRPLFESIAGFLRERSLLLILDGCEHLAPDCARLGEALLAESPGLVIVAGSREPLRTPVETVWPLAPLHVPVAGERGAARLRETEAVRLFLERAAAANPRRRVEDAHLEAVAALVRRLDGLPLAIEMSAALLRAMGPEEILGQLTDRFRLLERGAATGLPRHRTLRAALDWSYQLLEPAEQLLLQRLAVFAGAVPLDVVTSVCSGDPLDPGGVASLVTSLVDRSLLALEPAPDRTAYVLLETVREYARLKLEEAGDAAWMLDRHLEWCIGAAESAYRSRLGHEGEVASRLGRVLEELRAAHDRSLEREPGPALHLAGLLCWLFGATGRFQEGVDRAERSLAAGGAEVDRARTLTGLGTFAVQTGELQAAVVRLQEAIEIWRRLREPEEECVALDGLGWAHFWFGENEAALRAFQDASRAARPLENPDLERRLLVGECQVLVAMEVPARARPLAERLVRDSPAADLRTSNAGQHFLGDCALQEGDPARALGEYGRALELACEMNDPMAMTFEMEGIAMAQAGLGQDREALLLGGAAAGSFRAMSVEVEVPFWLRLRERYLDAARRRLADDAEAIWSEGLGQALSSAVARALTLARPGSLATER